MSSTKRRCAGAAALFWIVIAAVGGAAQGAAVDDLLRLVPRDAGVTLTVEDLRGHARQFADSPLSRGLWGLPAVRAWRNSPKFHEFEGARKGLEQALGEKIENVRDQLLGEAVVLTLHVAEGGALDQAHGLLLTRVSDRAILERAITILNDSQKKEGLTGIADRTWNGSTYHVREFRQGGRPTEYYAIVGDETFAWSNSEDLIKGVIERRARGSSSLSDNPRFQNLRAKLPARPAASLFINPRFVERAIAALPPAAKPEEVQFQAFLARYFGSLEYAGICLEWRDGLVAHMHELFDPAKVEPWIKRWASATKRIDPAFVRIPGSALAVATASVDFAAVGALIDSLTPDAGKAKLQNLAEVLRGALLGRDLATAILPNLGPGLLAYAEAPQNGDSKGGVPMVLAIQVGDSGVAAAIDNALRTFLAVYALDEKHEQGRLRVVSREVGVTKVTSLDSATPFAYGVDRGRVVIANSAEAVIRALSSEVDPRLTKIREKYFPGIESFAWLDLLALHKVCTANRERLVKHLAETHHRSGEAEGPDLDQVLAFIDLFQAAYLTSEVSSDASAIHRSFGLIAKP